MKDDIRAASLLHVEKVPRFLRFPELLDLILNYLDLHVHPANVKHKGISLSLHSSTVCVYLQIEHGSDMLTQMHVRTVKCKALHL